MYTKLTWPVYNLKSFIEEKTVYNCLLDLECDLKLDYKLALTKMVVNENLILVLYETKFDHLDLVYSSRTQNCRELFCYDLSNNLILTVDASYTSFDRAVSFPVLYGSVRSKYIIHDCKEIYEDMNRTYTERLMQSFDNYFKDSNNAELLSKYSSRISERTVNNRIKPLYVKNKTLEEVVFSIPTYESDYLINMVYKYIINPAFLDDLVQKTFNENIQGFTDTEITAYVNYNILNKALENLKNSPNEELNELKNIYNLTKNAGQTLTVTTESGDTCKVYNDLNLEDNSFRVIKGYDHISVKDITTIKFNGQILFER